MSLILDALARAERDRRGEERPAPDLLAEHGPVSQASPVAQPRLLVVLVLALVFAGTALWFALRDGQERVDDAGGSATLDRPDTPASAARPPVQAAGNRATNTRVPASDEGQRPRLGPPRSVRAPADANGPPAVVAPASEAVSPAAIAKLYEQTGERAGETGAGAARDVLAAASAARRMDSRDTPSGPEPMPDAGERGAARNEEPVDLEQVLRQARAEVAASSLSEHPAPLLQTLSKQYRDRVPTLMYLRHDYNPAGTSSVLINGQILGVGNRSRGVEVREILADSVILRFEEREFRLRALNSWVNL